jgi:flagellar protein FliS
MSLPIPQPTASPRAHAGTAYGTAYGAPARPVAAAAASPYASQAARYRDAELASASPGQLVVMLFDKILLTLRRARLAVEGQRIEDRVEQLLKANEMISELRLSLDFEQGGAIAQNLDALYAFSLRQLFEATRTADVAKIDAVSRIMGELREGFATVVAGGTGEATALPAAARSA